MSTIAASVKRHPVLSYYILTFVLSWGAFLLVIGGPGGIPGTPGQFERLIPLAIPALLLGPSLSGLLLTGFASGKARLRELLSRLLRWRVGAGWYAVALLAAPFLMTAIPLAMSLFSPEFLPGLFTADDKASLLLLGIAAGLAAGIFEEIGWTGFATPRLRSGHSTLATGLIVGFLWGAWHLPVNFWSSGDASGALSLPLLLHSLIFSMGILPAFRVLMVWVYDRTESLLLAMLMHLSLTTSNVLFVPKAMSGATGAVWSLALAAALWIVVAAVYLKTRYATAKTGDLRDGRA